MCIRDRPGKDPFIVLGDANLKKAAEELAFAKYLYAGQTCTAPERIYVHDRVYDDFVRRFLELSRKVRLGDPEDPETEMGPVISQEAQSGRGSGQHPVGASGGRSKRCGTPDK